MITEEENLTLPPIIQNMIDQMNSVRNAPHVRDNYAATLEKVATAMTSQVNQYYRNKHIQKS